MRAGAIAVEITPEPGGTLRFDVTMRSDEPGQDKYPDLWQVLLTEGVVLRERLLPHPHETGQSSGRSLPGLRRRGALHLAHDFVAGLAGPK